MRDAVIVAPVQMPIRRRNGGWAGGHLAGLSALVLQALSVVPRSTRGYRRRDTG